ncbi:hypothetical protein GCM10023178_76880 [Actinomadura luteofluorescens]
MASDFSPSTPAAMDLVDAAGVDAELARVLRIRVPDLAAYQNLALAGRYLDAVLRVARAEDAAGAAGNRLAVAVARNLYKLMAYKDEYEVARLHLDPELARRVEEQFGPGSRVAYMLHPPLLRAVARLPGEEARLTPQAARIRLEALGYADPAGALRHIEALTSGVSRRAAIQRTLLPVMLGWFADAPDPDAGLLGFRQVSDALGTTPWYLRLLRDEVTVAERMAWVLGSSRYA